MAKELIARHLLGAIEGLQAAANYDWMTLVSNVRVEGDLSGSDNPWSVTVVLPQGAWIPTLLTGELVVVAGSYAVLAPRISFIEVELDAQVGNLLKAIRQLLRMDWTLFRNVVRNALQRAFGLDVCCVRVTTSAVSVGRDSRKKTGSSFPPDHIDSRIMVGMEVRNLLSVARNSPDFVMQLGFPPGLPIALAVPCPTPPGHVVNALRKVPVGTFAVRFRRPGAQPVTRDIVLGHVGPGVDRAQTAGHLPSGWLSDNLINSVACKAWALQLLRQVFRSAMRATTMVPVGRLKKGGGDPAYLYVMFSSDELAAAFCLAIDNKSFPPAVLEALTPFLDLAGGELITFNAFVPPEALQGAAEKDIVGLFRDGMSEAACINPPHDVRV
jgi:hypothetical protein